MRLAEHAVALRRIMMPTARRAVRQNRTLLRQHAHCLGPLLRRHAAFCQQACQGGDAVPIHAPEAPRQLIRMATTFDHQRLIDQPHRSVARDAQPEIVVLTGRQRLVEAADALEE